MIQVNSSIKLVVDNGPDKGHVFPLVAGSPLIVGRGQTSHTKLGDPHASRNHCEVRLEAGRVLVTDSGSVSGTFVNGQRITTQELRAGDIIRVGETDLRFECPAADESTLPPTPLKSSVPPGAEPPKELVFAQKARGQTLSKPLQVLHGMVGQSLAGYQITKILGTGTIGVVFLATSGKAQKTVALKVLKSDFARDDKARQRFLRGVKTAFSLDHPNLIAIHNAGISDGLCWIALEFVEGESLAHTMKAGKSDWASAWQLAVHITKALGYIHDQGVIHRNVMPQNIMIQSRDRLAKLGDVILAKALEEENVQPVTASGELVGNVYYLAPERTLGKDDDVDGRADIYSLGATVYAMLTGQHPVQGSSMIEVVTKIRTITPERPRKIQPSIPEVFEALVMKMLAKRPEDRFQTAAQLLIELERVQSPKK